MTYGQMDYRKIDSRSKLRKLGRSSRVDLWVFSIFNFVGPKFNLDHRKNSANLWPNLFLSTQSLAAELEAYSSLVNAFRAQGNFTKEKKKILNELRSFLR